MSRTDAFLQVIHERWSCRRFAPDPLTSEQILRLLGAMVQSPTAGNRQPWKVYVVRNLEIRGALTKAAHGQKFVGEAPAVFVVCAVPEESGQHYGERGRRLYALQDTAAMAQSLLLAACAMGLGSCWVGAFRESDVAAAVGAAEGERPVALVPVGYAAELRKPMARKPLAEVATFLD